MRRQTNAGEGQIRRLSVNYTRSAGVFNFVQLPILPQLYSDIMLEEKDKPTPTEALACPICRRPLRRTSHRLLTALECEQCGPFSDFEHGSTRAFAPNRELGPDDPGSDPTG